MSSKPIEIHFEKSLNNLNLVQETDVAQRREFLIVSALAVLMALGVIAYGWQHYQNLDLGYRIEAASKERAKLIKTREKLRNEQQTLRSPERIYRMSRSMGLDAPAPGQVKQAPLGMLSTPDSEPELAAR